MKKPRILISTSGGRTSALMAWMLFNRFKDSYEMLFVFANTSRQFDKTPVRFFRSGESIDDLVEESKNPFELAIDQSLKTEGAEYDFELDEQEDCAESCEPF